MRLVNFSTVLLFFLLGLIVQVQSQQDSISNNLLITDSLIVSKDTIIISDSLKKPRIEEFKNKNEITSEVLYESADSLIISNDEEKLYLYKKGKVTFEDIELTAGYIEFSMSDNVVKATSISDTSGKVEGKPLFIQGEDKFDADTIRYNFKSEKGSIKNVMTKQGEGYLFSNITKKQANGHIHLKQGRYTTCDDPHPHYYIAMTKAINIPDDMTISGPAYLVIEDIPTPLFIPFGFFPNTETRSAGIIIPSYGEEETRGFMLRDGGFYWPINDYMDLTLKGSYFTKGSWGLAVESNYKKRYKYSGSFRYRRDLYKIDDDLEVIPRVDYSLSWNHRQDPKANPTQSFNTQVNISSSSYDKLHSTNTEDYLSSSKTSSISYNKLWNGKPSFALTANLNHNQNKQNKSVTLTVPDINFSTTEDIYPFRRKNAEGKSKWYEKIKTRYSAQLKNQISTNDSLYFTKNDMRNGFEHTIPIIFGNINILNIINITPSTTYQGNVYFSKIKKRLNDTSSYSTNKDDVIITDTIYGIFYAHGITAPSLNFNVSRDIYGIFQSTRPNSYIVAIRHVLKPSVSFGLMPDISKIMPNYNSFIRYPTSINAEKIYEEEYSVYSNSYFTPYEAAKGNIGSISFSLNNNLEMKVRSDKDSSKQFKKVPILRNLNFATSYNPVADSMRWSQIRMNGATNLFSNIDITFDGTFDPYDLNKNGNRINNNLIAKGKLPRTVRLSYGLTMRFKSNGKTKSSNDYEEELPQNIDENEIQTTAYGDYINFSIPWNFNIRYNWNMNKSAFKKIYSHTIDVDGQINLTKNWNLSGRTGYDFIKGDITYPTVSITRDMHCWTLSMSAVVAGPRKNYMFSIKAKASLLQDLKYDKRKSWYDYN